LYVILALDCRRRRRASTARSRLDDLIEQDERAAKQMKQDVVVSTMKKILLRVLAATLRDEDFAI